MQSPSDNVIEHFLQTQVLSLFPLPDGNLIWQGSSELNAQASTYYFCIDNANYLLVNESHHGVGDNALHNLVIGNAVAPHQKVVSIRPKEGARHYVNLANKKIKTIPQLTGDFSVFLIQD